MARRSVFLYGVIMGHGNKEEKVVYCYARNAGLAIENYKQLFKEEKYDHFRAKMFGEADVRVHDKPFEPMTKEEVEYISKNGLAKADAYAQRKSTLPQGEFVPVDQMPEGELV